jgi:hypothetical protein
LLLLVGCEKRAEKHDRGFSRQSQAHKLSMLIDFFMQECPRLSDQINFNVYNKQLPAQISFATFKAECIICISVPLRDEH